MFFASKQELHRLEAENARLIEEKKQLQQALDDAQAALESMQQQQSKDQFQEDVDLRVSDAWWVAVDAMTDVKTEMSNFSHTMRSQRDEFAASMKSLDSLLGLLNKNADATEIINRDTISVAESISNLKNVTEGINGFITLIQGI